jgi:hypothetical protein
VDQRESGLLSSNFQATRKNLARGTPTGRTFVIRDAGRHGDLQSIVPVVPELWFCHIIRAGREGIRILVFRPRATTVVHGVLQSNSPVRATAVSQQRPPSRWLCSGRRFIRLVRYRQASSRTGIKTSTFSTIKIVYNIVDNRVCRCLLVHRK